MDQTTARIIRKFPSKASDIAQSYTAKQIKCKQWLHDVLVNMPIPDPKRIFIVGAWYGNIIVPHIRSIYPDTFIKLHDIDEEITEISKLFFEDDALVKSYCVDSSDYFYKHFVINTSCEHMMPLKIKKGSYAVLQSNNYYGIEGHINCVDSVDELIDQYKLSEVYYTGQLEFEKYTRFMAIGKV